MNQFIYYSPYFIQFIFLYIFINQNNKLINFFNIEIGKESFKILGIFTLLIIVFNKFSYSYYTNDLLIFYILQTLIYYEVLTISFNIKDSISLSLLISFATSFYWEIPIHFIVLFNGEPLFNILIQLMHFACLPFIFKRIIINDKKKFYNSILYGLILNDLLAMTSYLLITGHNNLFNHLMRILSSTFIVYGFILNIKRK